MFHRLLAPSLAYSLGLAFAAMADAIVIGWQMGVTGLAALCFSLPLHTMLLAFVHGLGLGGSTRYARLLAEGKPAQATDCFNRVLQAGLAVSVLLAALVNLFPQAILELLGTTPADGTLYTAAKGYLCLIASGAPLFLLKYVLNDFLRSDDNRRLATRGSLYGNAIRIALDLVLVPGLGMGTAGAAGAALIGLSVSVLCYMPALFAKDRTLHLAAARPNPRETLSCLKSGLPAAAPYLYRMVFFLLANHLLLRLEGENGVAVFAVVQSTAYLILYIYIGAAKAAQPLFRTFYGEKNLPAARRALAFALVDLKRADALAKAPACRGYAVELDAMAARVRAEVAAGCPLTVRELPVGGGDVIRERGLEPGPGVGLVLDALLSAVLAGELGLGREELLAELRMRE